VEVAPAAAEVDAEGRAVLPGLVDCHTHLVFAGDRTAEFAARSRGEPYAAGGVAATVAATRAAPREQLERLALARLDRFLAHGVTTVEAKSGYGLTPGDERRLLEVAAGLGHPVDVVRTFMGAHVVPPEHAGNPDAYVDLVCGMLPSLGLLAEFCDVWCDRGAFTPAQARRVLRAARQEGLGLKVHAEQLEHSGGAGLAAEHAAVSADHLEHATADDAAALARSRTVGVLLPGASLMTGMPPAPARMLIANGVRVALSTDFNPGSSPSENLQLAVALGCALLHLTPEEAILGVTRHAAAALAREGRIGSLAPGGACDVLVLESGNEIDLAYHYGVNLTRTVVKSGRVVV
jgi:imidazolonepropionase